MSASRRVPTADEIIAMPAKEYEHFIGRKHPIFRHPSEPSTTPPPAPRRRPNSAERIAIEDDHEAYALWRNGKHPEFLHVTQNPGPHDKQDPPMRFPTLESNRKDPRSPDALTPAAMEQAFAADLVETGFYRPPRTAQVVDPLSMPMGNYMPPGSVTDLRPSAEQAAEAKGKGQE